MHRRPVHLRILALQLLAVVAATITLLAFPSALALVHHKNNKDNDDVGGATFVSKFHRADNSNFVGPKYWANPLEAWKIEDGEVHADGLGILNPSKEVFLPLLTHQIEHPEDGFEMETTVRFTSDPSQVKNATWAGFSIGLQGAIEEDYRNAAVRPLRRLQAGIRAVDGRLFCKEIHSEVLPPLDPNNNSNNKSIRNMNNIARKEQALSLEEVYETSHRLILSYDGSTLRLWAKRSSEWDLLEVEVPSDTAVLLKGVVALAATTCRASFSEWSVKGDGVVYHPDQTFGPIAWTQYTLDETTTTTNTLKLSVQMAAVPIPSQVSLEIEENDGGWGCWTQQGDAADVDPLSRTALFRYDDWDASKDTSFRIKYTWSGKEYYYEGTIRKPPNNDGTTTEHQELEDLSIAVFSCDHGYVFPLPNMVRNVQTQDPDLVFFAGDQIYEHFGGYGCRREGPTEVTILDYLHKWFLFGWTWRDVLRDRPSVMIVDDHDIFMGNLWGAGGRMLDPEEKKFAGGYGMPADFVNAVQRTQTSHMPEPFDPTPIDNDIGVYYTDWKYGGVSLAVIEDRKWKSGPGKFSDGIDPPGAELLGERQEEFLEDWSQRTESDTLRVVMSATMFAQPSTHTGIKLTEVKAPITDTNGWPKSGRDRALRPLMNNPNTVMLCGDQHMGILLQHGIDDHGDGPYAFMVPGTANGYPRAWWPEGPEASIDTWTGDFVDGFDNKFSVFAASNPNVGSNLLQVRGMDVVQTAHERGSGYGVLTVRRQSSGHYINFDMWRFDFDATDANPETDQFSGFPKYFRLEEAGHDEDDDKW